MLRSTLKLPTLKGGSLIIAVACLVIAGFMGGQLVQGPFSRTVTTTLTQTQTIYVTRSGEVGGWREVARFTGQSEGGTTVPFYISTSSWRIRCSHAGTVSSFSHLAFGVYPEGKPSNAQTIIAEGSTSTGTEGTAVQYFKGPGSFYLYILPAFVVMWTVIIEVPA